MSAQQSYPAPYEVSLRHGQHCTNTLAFVQEHILPHLAPEATWRATTCLDVGCGDGTIARLLSPFFARIVGIDAEPRYFEEAEAGRLRLRPPLICGCGAPGCSTPPERGREDRIQLLAADFLAADLHGQLFDLVLLSHVLYAMPLETLQAWLEKALAATAPGGWLLIGHTAQRGLAYELTHSLNPHIVASTHIVQALSQLGVPCRVFPSPNPIQLAREDQVAGVLKFVAMADCITPGEPGPSPQESEQAIQQFLPKALRCPGGGFVIQDEHEFILVHKAAA